MKSITIKLLIISGLCGLVYTLSAIDIKDTRSSLSNNNTAIKKAFRNNKKPSELSDEYWTSGRFKFD
jgi:uncharacterized protein (UPF0218 family)